MKKIISIFLCTVILLTSIFNINAFAESIDRLCSYTNYNGDIIYYYRDTFDNTYVYENGKKEYIAIPVCSNKVTDENELAELRAAFNQQKASISTKGIYYTK
ncbi:MAG TPA: hypothetical protein DCR23_05810, partial [Ruminococcaceae bacterium]|nr:hypothetical protein [Oscillospiraceae bacterium]